MKENVWSKRVYAVVLAVAACIIALTLAACDNNEKVEIAEVDGDSVSEQAIRVGSKDFTENLIVAELYALALEDTGYTVDRDFDIAGTLVHTAIVSDEIDLYPEYTGTGLLSILQVDLITDPQEVYDVVKREYNERFQITWLDQSKANDGQGLVIRTETAQALDISTISDLQEKADQIRFASQGEFDERDDGIPALERTYGEFNFASSTVYDNGLKYQILENDEADVAPAYTTEGQLVNTELFTLLEDDKQVWPPYFLTPIVQNSVLEENPEIADALNRISAALDTETVTKLNARVDVDKEEYADVARDFYGTLN